MTVVTRFVFKSGDRDALDGVIDDIVETSRRKGAQLKGPHRDPPIDHQVSLYRHFGEEPEAVEAAASTWTYTVFQRRVALHGHDDLAREFLERDYPDSIQVEAEVG
ncbi:MAG: 30S ribosomal protein S10 [Halanaeroarchaeum sp.]